jgi:hypothetical protein
MATPYHFIVYPQRSTSTPWVGCVLRSTAPRAYRQATYYRPGVARPRPRTDLATGASRVRLLLHLARWFLRVRLGQGPPPEGHRALTVLWREVRPDAAQFCYHFRR